MGKYVVVCSRKEEAIYNMTDGGPPVCHPFLSNGGLGVGASALNSGRHLLCDDYQNLTFSDLPGKRVRLGKPAAPTVFFFLLNSYQVFYKEYKIQCQGQIRFLIFFLLQLKIWYL